MAALAGCLMMAALIATAAVSPSAPARSGLHYPAGPQQSPQPAGLFVDSHGELFVADAVGSRIVIYDHRGNYQFEFSTSGRLSSPRQLAVDEEGRILVLGDSRPRSLAVFDYDGEFLHYLDVPCQAPETEQEPASFAISRDRIFFLRPLPARITEMKLDGSLVREFDILQEMDDETRNAPVLGSLAVISELLVIPLPMMSQVARYTTEGKFHDLFGMAGGAPGELSFPVSVAGDGRDGIVVLDKHRHTVLHYDANGTFTHEIGGFGQTEGWFYYPSAIAAWTDGRCVIGQSFMNRLQLVSVFDTPVGEAVTPVSR